MPEIKWRAARINLKGLLFLLVLAAAFTVFGCVSPGDLSRTATPTPEPTLAPSETEPGKLGGFCGGIAGIMCKEGFCDYTGDYPDAGGFCRPESQGNGGKGGKGDFGICVCDCNPSNPCGYCCP